MDLFLLPEINQNPITFFLHLLLFFRCAFVTVLLLVLAVVAPNFVTHTYDSFNVLLTLLVLLCVDVCMWRERGRRAITILVQVYVVYKDIFSIQIPPPPRLQIFYSL